MSPYDRTQDFLSKHQLYANSYSHESILSSFLDEMDKGLAGEKSCLAMIPSYVSIPETPPKNEKIIVLDAGGTNFRTALISFDKNSKPKQEYFVNNPMPGVGKEISKDDFFNKIVDFMEPVLSESKRLGFCFSYPSTIDNHRDGTLVCWTKEIKAPQVVGQKILANLSETLRKRGLSCPEHMLILNDTVSSLLAGVTSTGFSSEYNYIGFILGTGTNTAYIEQNSAIKKVPRLPEGKSMAINCESANFNQIGRSDIDVAFDRTTSTPGKHVFEKMISGGYLGNLCYAVLLTAGEEDVFTPQTRELINNVYDFSTPFLSTILSDSLAMAPDFINCPKKDLDAIKTIIEEMIERAALFTAVNMAAAVVKCAQSNGSTKKYCISADGSVYYKLFGFRERTEKHLAKILQPYNVEYTIVQTDDAPIIGTAVAGLVD